MEGFELYAIYRREAVHQDFVTATWEGLTNRHRDLWNEVARGVTVIASNVEGETPTQKSPLTDREIGAATSGEKP